MRLKKVDSVYHLIRRKWGKKEEDDVELIYNLFDQGCILFYLISKQRNMITFFILFYLFYQLNSRRHDMLPTENR